MPKSQKPDGAVAGSSKRLASRFYQIKTGHYLTGQYLNRTKNRPTPQSWWCRYPNQTLQGVSGVEGPAEDPVGGGTQGDWEGKGRWKIRDLLADERCGRAVLDFLYSTDVGRRVPAKDDDAVSTVSELEVQEWLKEQGAGAGEPSAGGTPLFLPTPDFMAPAGPG